jgi:DNA-binding GntR family transcriptional regulator
MTNMRYAEPVTSPGPNLAAQIERAAAPLRTQVLDVLRNAILTMQFAPGQRLIERELIDLTGVSRTTIREALRELAAEGLVKTIPQKGAIVVALSPEEAEELYDLREVLESHLVRRFVARAPDGDIVRLRRVLTRLADAVESGAATSDLLVEKDRLYEVLLDGAGNSALRASLSQLHARVSLLRASSLSSSPDRPRRSVEEIRRIVEAVEERDADRAAAATVAHLRAAAAAGIRAVTAAEVD